MRQKISHFYRRNQQHFLQCCIVKPNSLRTCKKFMIQEALSRSVVQLGYIEYKQYRHSSRWKTPHLGDARRQLVVASRHGSCGTRSADGMRATDGVARSEGRQGRGGAATNGQRGPPHDGRVAAPWRGRERRSTRGAERRSTGSFDRWLVPPRDANRSLTTLNTFITHLRQASVFIELYVKDMEWH
jgi:hypothetical protein